jgi:hypothetical protein
VQQRGPERGDHGPVADVEPGGHAGHEHPFWSGRHGF